MTFRTCSFDALKQSFTSIVSNRDRVAPLRWTPATAATVMAGCRRALCDEICSKPSSSNFAMHGHNAF